MTGNGVSSALAVWGSHARLPQARADPVCGSGLPQESSCWGASPYQAPQEVVTENPLPQARTALSPGPHGCLPLAFPGLG